jgi:elongation factor 3
VAKLVDNEHTIRPFLPKILPGLIKLEEQVADPEARGVVHRAIKTVQDVAKVDGDGSNAPPARIQDAKPIAANLIAAIKKFFPSTHLTATSPLAVYISQLASALINARNFELVEWETALVPYVALGIPEAAKAQTIVKELLERSAKTAGGEVEILEDEEEGEVRLPAAYQSSTDISAGPVQLHLLAGVRRQDSAKHGHAPPQARPPLRPLWSERLGQVDPHARHP